MPSPTAYTTLVDADTLARHIDERDWLLLDCRFSLADPEAGRRQFTESRLPGARHVDLERDLSGPTQPGVTGRHPLPDAHTLAARLATLGVCRRSQVIAYDAAAGPMAARLWWLLRWLGHERGAVLDGGFAAWQASGHPIERTPPRAPGPDDVTGDLTVGTPLLESVDMAEVASGGRCLLDARERARFVGEHEPIDPVAGHIPGARNHPFTDNLDADGRFLPPATLRERFTAALGSGADTALTHYCGSGVTAAHNVLAMTHAGLDAGALYAGSFSEWITRHDVARGGD